MAVLKSIPIRRVIVVFADRSQVAFTITKRWEMLVKRDIVDVAPKAGFKQHQGLDSGELTLEASYDRSVFTAPRPRRKL